MVPLFVIACVDVEVQIHFLVYCKLYEESRKSMITSCTVRVIHHDNRNSLITVLPCMCITQDTFIDFVMSWYDHYCADANILILFYLPCWPYIFSTIAFMMWKSFVCKFVSLMLNVFILVHRWFMWIFCYMPCILLYFMLYMYFYHVLC